jgi:FOG: FHA domain
MQKEKQYPKELSNCFQKFMLSFTKEADGWYVEDLNSTNGTYANDKRITKKTKIENGDIIKLSLSIAFKAVIEKH